MLFVLDSTGSVTKDYQAQVDYIKTAVDGMTLGEDAQKVRDEVENERYSIVLQAGVLIYSSEQRKSVAIPIGSMKLKHPKNCALTTAWKLWPSVCRKPTTG